MGAFLAQVLIPKYGLEGTLFLRPTKAQQAAGEGVEWVYDEEEPSQTCGEVKLTLFMKLGVQVFLDSSDVQHEKLCLRLVSPSLPGFSVQPVGEGKRPAHGEGEEASAKRAKS